MALLDHRLHRAADADAIAAHDDQVRLLPVVGEARADPLGVLGAELEDVARPRCRGATGAAGPTADTARPAARGGNPRSRVTARSRADVDIAQVEAVLVRPRRAVADKADRVVGVDPRERAGIFDRPLTAPRLPGLAPMTGSISSGVAGRRSV